MMQSPQAEAHAPLRRTVSAQSDGAKSTTTSAPSHRCLECNAFFTRPDHLKRHMSSLHRGATAKPYTCEYCGKGFVRRDVLTRHHNSCIAAKPIHNPSGVDTGPQSRTSLPSMKDLGVGLGATVDPCRDTAKVTFQTSLPSPAASNRSQDDPASMQLNPASCSQPRPGDNNAMDVDRSTAAGSKPRRPANKRGNYVSNACIQCQKRKVKCSGDATCSQCRAAGVPCLYRTTRQRRRTKRAASDASMTTIGSVAPLGDDSATLLASLRQMMARIAELESAQRALMDNRSSTGGGDEDDMNSDFGTDDFGSDDGADSANGTDAPSPPSCEPVYGATSLLEAIDSLNRSVTNEGDLHPEPLETIFEPDTPIGAPWDKLLRSEDRDMKTIERKTRMMCSDVLHKSVKIFFDDLNPSYPFLNENQFQIGLKEFLNTKTQQSPPSADWYQRIALINLVHAVVQVNSDSEAFSQQAPGWEEFCRAETVFSHLVWLGNGNILTVQCLLLRAMYLLFLEKADSAYDTIGRVVRLCFQIGLHNQSSWKDCTPFEIAMRQRIFWIVMWLERNIAFSVGAPYLIRDGDFKVDPPKNYNDKLMFPNQPLPEEMPEWSTAPYVCAQAKWSKLCSEIWDRRYSVNAAEKDNEEFPFSIDGRISYIESQTPPYLQLQYNLDRLYIDNGPTPFIHNLSLILHLRMNQLRLLLRRDRMFSLKYTEEDAAQCLSVAASTINSVHAYHTSKKLPNNRFHMVLFIVGALLTLVCIIIKPTNSQQIRAEAIEVYLKGLGILYEEAPKFHSARHALQRLSRLIHTAKSAIQRFENPNQGSGTDDTQAGSTMSDMTLWNDMSAAMEPTSTLFDFNFFDINDQRMGLGGLEEFGAFNEYFDTANVWDFESGKGNTFLAPTDELSTFWI